jgi:hypothetical protein
MQKKQSNVKIKTATRASKYAVSPTKDRWASDVIVDLMHMYDLPHASLNPGASYRGLHDSIVNYGQNRPTMMLCQHEETAVQIAHGYAKATGKPMIAILHNLVGLLHANMAIYYAYIDPCPRVHRRRHRPDGRDQAPPAHRLDPYGAGGRARRCGSTRNGLPAAHHRRRAGVVRPAPMA